LLLQLSFARTSTSVGAPCPCFRTWDNEPRAPIRWFPQSRTPHVRGSHKANFALWGGCLPALETWDRNPPKFPSEILQRITGKYATLKSVQKTKARFIRTGPFAFRFHKSASKKQERTQSHVQKCSSIKIKALIQKRNKLSKHHLCAAAHHNPKHEPQPAQKQTLTRWDSTVSQERDSTETPQSL
jgi:hypothetical protein